MAARTYGYVKPKPYQPARSLDSSYYQMAGLLGQTKSDPASLFNSDPFGVTAGAQPAAPSAAAPARQSNYTAAPDTTGQTPQPGQQPGQQQPAPQAAQVSFDYAQDPVLLNVQAASVKSRAEAQQAALEQQKQLAIQEGDADYARNVLKDALTAEAASKNPDSVLARLKTTYDQGAQSLDQQLNQHNLFYGGERARQQGLLGENYRGAQVDAASQFQNQNQQIRDTLMQQLLGFDQADQQAQADAYNRALQLALAGGYGSTPTDSGATAPPPESSGVPEAQPNLSPNFGILLHVSGSFPAPAPLTPNYGIPSQVSGTFDLAKALAPKNAYNRKTVANLH